MKDSNSTKTRQNITCQILEPLLGQISHQVLVAALPDEIWLSQTWNKRKIKKPVESATKQQRKYLILVSEK